MCWLSTSAQLLELVIILPAPILSTFICPLKENITHYYRNSQWLKKLLFIKDHFSCTAHLTQKNHINRILKKIICVKKGREVPYLVSQVWQLRGQTPELVGSLVPVLPLTSSMIMAKLRSLFLGLSILHNKIGDITVAISSYWCKN
jgi:hypothetical protein